MIAIDREFVRAKKSIEHALLDVNNAIALLSDSDSAEEDLVRLAVIKTYLFWVRSLLVDIKEEFEAYQYELEDNREVCSQKIRRQATKGVRKG